MGSHPGRARTRRARAPERGRASGDRVGVLRWSHLSRGRRSARRARGNGEEPDSLGAEPAPGRTGRERGRRTVARELSRRELEELLGAYALDAVDDDEREQVEAYLARTPEARSLAAEYRETAALLAHGGTEAPAGL